MDDPGYAHVGRCSPWYREFRALQIKQAAPAASRGGWRYAAAAVVLLASAFAFWSLRREDTAPTSPPPLVQTGQTELRAELDLRRFAVLRSDRAAPEETPVELPTGLVELTLLLPVGSEPGAYDVQLLDADLRSRAAASRQGEIRDFVATVRAAMDLRGIGPGTYQLGVRREGEDWRLFPAESSKCFFGWREFRLVSFVACMSLNA